MLTRALGVSALKSIKCCLQQKDAATPATASPDKGAKDGSGLYDLKAHISRRKKGCSPQLEGLARRRQESSLESDYPRPGARELANRV